MYEMYLGLDISLTGTGLCIIDPDGRVVHAMCIATTPRMTDFHRQLHITAAICNSVLSYCAGKNTLVTIEDYSYGRRTGKSFVRSELIGMVKLYLTHVYGMETSVVSPSALKRFFAKGGTAKKADMISVAASTWGFVNTNDNIVDAFALAQYGYAKATGIGPLLRWSKLPSIGQMSPLLYPQSIAEPDKVNVPNIPRFLRLTKKVRAPTLKR